MIKTRVFLLFILLFSIALTSAVIYENSIVFNNSVSANYADECIVIIDAGHGGFDGGAIAADGTIEKNLNLSVANLLSSICKTNGIRVICVREDDSSLEDDSNASIRKRKNSDLHNRVKTMQRYENAIYISIHMNKFSNPNVHGAQIFYSPKFSQSKLLAETLQDYVNLFDVNNTKAIKQGTKDTFVLYNALCPAVIFECGFISNSNELELLKSYDYQRKIAFSIYLGISEYLNIKE